MEDASSFERERQRLEETVERFTDAVNLWRQWKEEYETLREDIKLLPAAATRQDRATARQDYEGELIDAKELVDIFGKDDSRSAEQILSVLTNRLDYVAKNIETLDRKVEDARRKLVEAESSAGVEGMEDQESLPLTEIVEQLDDDDNVISYTLRTPGKSQEQLMEALEKAGLKDVRASISAEPAQKVDDKSNLKAAKETPPAAAEATSPQLQVPIATPKEPPDLPNEKPTPKKSVKFSEDTKPEASQINRPTPTRTIEDILQEAAVQQIAIEDPVIPADDSPEDADLREDMLRYNTQTMMYEMAPIVAELQLEEGSDIDTEDDWDEDDLEVDDDDDDDDDEEDQWGRSTKSVVTDDWKRQMLELKERMSQHTFANTQPDDATKHDDKDERMEGVGRISIKREVPAETSSAKTTAEKEKKGVRFAPELDIADESKSLRPRSQPETATPLPPPSSKPMVDPLSDIVERKKSPAAAPKPLNPSKKPSRFKQSMSNPPQAPPVGAGSSFPLAPNGTPIVPEAPVDNTRYAPSGPEGQTLAETVLERKPSDKVVEPDEFDATLLHQQATEEYYKMRNKMVHRQGGFTKEDDSPVQPLGEEEGGPKKVSRFKAARLKKP